MRIRPPTAKRRAEPKPLSGSRPWIEVVVGLRSRYEAHRWRAACISDLYGWREFVVAWASCAPTLQSFGLSHLAPDSAKDDESLLAWSWAVVDDVIPGVLRACAARSPVDELSTATCFSIMQGGGLIFPDGGVSGRVLDRVSRELAVVEVAEAVAIVKGQIDLATYQGKLDKLKNGTKP